MFESHYTLFGVNCQVVKTLSYIRNGAENKQNDNSIDIRGASSANILSSHCLSHLRLLKGNNNNKKKKRAVKIKENSALRKLKSALFSL